MKGNLQLFSFVTWVWLYVVFYFLDIVIILDIYLRRCKYLNRHNLEVYCYKIFQKSYDNAFPMLSVVADVISSNNFIMRNASMIDWCW